MRVDNDIPRISEQTAELNTLLEAYKLELIYLTNTDDPTGLRAQLD